MFGLTTSSVVNPNFDAVHTARFGLTTFDAAETAPLKAQLQLETCPRPDRRAAKRARPP